MLIPLTLVVTALQLWLSGAWAEAAHERVMTCTVTGVHEGDGHEELASTATTAECGELVIPTDHLLTPPQFRTPPLNGHLEVGRTYRLRTGEIEPLFGPTFLRIIKIE